MDRIIGIVFDFDKTLGPDTILFTLKEQGIPPLAFWKEVNDMVNTGWDPPLAYMHLLLKLSKEKKLDPLRQESRASLESQVGSRALPSLTRSPS